MLASSSISTRTSIAAIAAGLAATLSAATARADPPACGSTYGSEVSSRVVTFPFPGADAEAEIGQRILSTLQIAEHVASITLNSEKVFVYKDIASTTIRLPAQTIPVTRIEGEASFVPQSYEASLTRNGKPLNGLARPRVVLSYQAKDHQLEMKAQAGFFRGTSSEDAGDTTVNTCARQSSQNLVREIVYSGVSNGTITLLYREFVNDLARPAFSQELRYDLRSGDEIGFKGARIKIISANNIGVKYRVVAPLK